MTVGDEAWPLPQASPKNSEPLSISAHPVRRLDVRPAKPAQNMEIDHACDGAREGDRVEREGLGPERARIPADDGGDGEVQRRTEGGRHPARRRRAEAFLRGQ